MAAPKKSRRRHHGRAPRPEVTKVKIINWEQLTWTRAITVVVGISAILGLVVAYEKASGILEPIAPGTRGYVREYADEATTKKFEPISKWVGDYDAFRIEQTLETAKLGLIALNENLIKATKEAETNPLSQILRDHVDALKRQVQDTKDRVGMYEKTLRERKAAATK